MSQQRGKVDRERYRASMARLHDIFQDISDTVTEVSRWRCPYKDARSRCTASFPCRNQRFTGKEGDPPICAGSDKLDYRSAWEV